MSILDYFRPKQKQQTGGGGNTYRVDPETAINGSKKETRGEELFRAADAAYEKRDYPSVIRCLESAAECGNCDAKRELGAMALRTDPQKAYCLFVEAAQGGNFKAAYDLGVMFRDGMGIEQDDAEAFKWFELGARLGSVKSINSLGMRYQNGLGVARDLKKAHGLIGKVIRTRDLISQPCIPWV